MTASRCALNSRNSFYGDVTPPEKTSSRKHLASCPECSKEHRALANVRLLLDLAKMPPGR